MTDETLRKRILKVRQSHGGCFTCKARRVKCDESRPFCQRCAKARRKCAGYKVDAPSTCLVPVRSLSSASSVTLDSDAVGELSTKLEGLRLSHLGCQVLHQNSVAEGGVASSFWSYTLPQLSQTSAVVHAAAAALGAAIESVFFRHKANSLSQVQRYGHAIRQVQAGISSDDYYCVPLVASCLLLAIADVLVARDLHALSHLKGTLALLQKRQHAQAKLPVSGSDCSPGEDRFSVSDEIDAAASILDVAAASYSLGMDCHLPKLDIEALSTLSKGHSHLAGLELKALKALHGSYSRATHATRWKYVASQLRDPGMTTEQAEDVARLRQIITEIGDALPTLPTQQRRRALVLRAQCTSTLIYVSNVLNPYEVGYDAFTESFRTLTSDAAAVLAQRHVDQRTDYTIDLLPDLGIIQPLYHTVSKCRHPLIRRKALAVLAQTGREGPFEGRWFASIGKRAIEIEEATALKHVRDATNKTSLSEFVPEIERMHGWGIDAATAALDIDDIMAFFTQCTSVELMMKCTNIDGHKADHFWRIWREKISVSTNVAAILTKTSEKVGIEWRVTEPNELHGMQSACDSGGTTSSQPRQTA